MQQMYRIDKIIRGFRARAYLNASRQRFCVRVAEIVVCVHSIKHLKCITTLLTSCLV